MSALSIPVLCCESGFAAWHRTSSLKLPHSCKWSCDQTSGHSRDPSDCRNTVMFSDSQAPLWDSGTRAAFDTFSLSNCFVRLILGVLHGWCTQLQNGLKKTYKKRWFLIFQGHQFLPLIIENKFSTSKTIYIALVVIVVYFQPMGIAIKSNTS